MYTVNDLGNVARSGWELLDKDDFSSAYKILKAGVDHLLPLTLNNLQSIITNDPNDKLIIAELLAGLARCYEHLNQAEAAMKLLELGLEICPQSEKAWSVKYESHKTRNEYRDGLTCSEKLIEIDQENYEGWNYRGNMLGFLGRIVEAFYCFQRSLEIVPMPFNMMAFGGIEQCKGAIKSSNYTMEAAAMLYERGATFLLKRDHRQASTYFRCVTAINPADKNAWAGLGVSLAMNADYEAAIASLERAIALDSNYLDALINRSITFLKWDKIDSAIDAFGSALDCDPTSVISWNGLGLCFLEKENYHQAILSFQKALEIDPRYYESMENLGRALIYQGDYEQAGKILGACLQIKPDSVKVSAILQGLDLIALEKDGSSKERISMGDLLVNRFEIRFRREGGMGIVYCAWDMKLIHMVALKTYKHNYLHNAQRANMFVKEATKWIRLGYHQNIVAAFDVETIDGKPYIIMEYVEGETLRNWIEQRKLNLYRTLDFCIQFCTGMIYISRQRLSMQETGMLHRDIKPENIMITKNEVVKITDFGLAKPFLDIISDEHINDLFTDRVSGLRGTLHYMSPEQLLGEKFLDVRSDIYSFGVVLYEMLTNKTPFGWNTILEYKSNIMNCEPASPTEVNPNIPELLGNIMLRCLKRNRDLRYANFIELRSDLLECYQSESLDIYPTEKLVDTKNANNENIAGLRLRAASEAQLNNFDIALQLFDKVLSMENDSFDWNNKGRTLILLGRHDEALICFDNAIKYASGRSGESIGWINKADAVINLGKFDDAIEYCDRALESAKGCENENILQAHAFCNKANALREQGKYQEALDYYEESANKFQLVSLKADLTPHPDELLLMGGFQEELLWYNRGLTLRLLGRTKEALDCQAKALAVNPNLPPAWAELGYQHIRNGNYESALDGFRKACEFNLGTNRLLLRAGDLVDLYDMTDVLETDGKYHESLSIYDILTLLRPNFHYYWTARGACLVAMEQHKEALGNFDKAISLSPTDYQPWLNKAYVLYDLGNFQEALKCANEAVRLNPQHKKAPALRNMCLEAVRSNGASKQD